MELDGGGDVNNGGVVSNDVVVDGGVGVGNGGEMSDESIISLEVLLWNEN